MQDKGERVMEKENNKVVQESVPLWKGIWTQKKKSKRFCKKKIDSDAEYTQNTYMNYTRKEFQQKRKNNEKRIKFRLG